MGRIVNLSSVAAHASRVVGGRPRLSLLGPALPGRESAWVSRHLDLQET